MTTSEDLPKWIQEARWLRWRQDYDESEEAVDAAWQRLYGESQPERAVESFMFPTGVMNHYGVGRVTISEDFGRTFILDASGEGELYEQHLKDIPTMFDDPEFQ